MAYSIAADTGSGMRAIAGNNRETISSIINKATSPAQRLFASAPSFAEVAENPAATDSPASYMSCQTA